MIVLAGTLASDNTLPAYQSLALYYLPKWILDKIFITSSDIIEAKTMTLMQTDNGEFYIRTTANTIFSKITASQLVNIRLTDALASTTYNRAFRIQFDLLIDTD